MFRASATTKSLSSYKFEATLRSPSPNPVAFSPDKISGLQFWYKADAITGKSNGDVITSWTDYSGRNAHAVTASGGTGPVYTTNFKNGLPALHYSGTYGEYLSLTSASFTNGSTIFVVSHISGSQANAGHISMAAGGMDYVSGDAFTMGTGHSGGVATGGNYLWRGITCTDVSTTYNKVCLWRGTVEDVGSGNIKKEIVKDGSVVLDTRTAAGSSTCSPTYGGLNARFQPDATGGGGVWTKQYQLEVIVYGNYIGTFNISLVESYLNNKYLIY